MSDLKHKRLLVKFSGESVAGDDEHGIDPKILDSMATSIKDCKDIDAEIGIVIGGGNLFRGEKLNQAGMDRVAGDHMGMMATVINSICLQEVLEQRGVTTRVMSAIDIRAVAEPYIKRRADRHLEKSRVVIFAAGTGNPFFTTDTAAVLRASEISAEIVIKATKTDGVYDKDPMLHADAIRYEQLNYAEVLKRNLKVMDSTAIAFCKDNDLPIMVLDINAPNSILRAACGEPVGTLIS